jgi:hypothetical protein
MHTQRSALAVVLVPLALAATAGATSASCVPAAAKTLRSSGAARIYSEGSILYGCLGTRRTRLGPLRGTVPFPATRVALYALSSRYAGIDRVQMGVDTFKSAVLLVDLRTGNSVATAPGTTPEPRPESFITVTAMVVDAKGTLAWIGQRSAIGVPAPTHEVHALNAARDRLLASSATIAVKSLRLRGETISWREGGHTRSATL